MFNHVEFKHESASKYDHYQYNLRKSYVLQLNLSSSSNKNCSVFIELGHTIPFTACLFAFWYKMSTKTQNRIKTNKIEAN